MKKIIALADVHFSKEAQNLVLASLQCALETGRRERIDAWAFSGDLFDRSIVNSEAAGLPRLVSMIQAMLEVAPIVSIYGTPSHDTPGAYSILQEIRGKHDFINLPPAAHQVVNGILFLGLPEVGREYFLAGMNGMSADEANKKILLGMRAILLGLGAIRQEHVKLPAVLLFHGEIRGASMQNGQIASGSLALGREDLELVNFTFANLGHIHIAQKIEGLNAWYPGSVFPVSWGEVDQKSCNMAELSDDPEIVPLVTRIPFPYAPRRKFTVTWPEPVGDEVAGFQSWICIKARKEEAAKIDKAAVLEAYLEQGALPGSRVTVEILPTETVRAAEITEKHALAEKVQIYTQASGDGFMDDLVGAIGHAKDIVAKCGHLEREASAAGVAPEGLHIRLRKLRLRGAIGIWKGQGVDEIELDFDRLDPGLAALIERNGGGKTTLIENCHPYGQMLTRDGTLQSHFRLRDSFREITFTDERTGDEYRSLIQIDGANASGSCEYHLFKNGEPLTDGRKKSYDEAVERLFGTLPLFLRSAFVSQRSTKNNPDLSEATKGEKKALFRELAGLDYLQAYAESAKQKADGIEKNISEERARVNLLESQLTALPGIRAERDAKSADLDHRQSDLHGLELRGLSLKSDADQFQQQVTEQKAEAARIEALKEQAEGNRLTASESEVLIAGYRAAVQQAPAAQKVLDQWTELKEKENAENGRLAAVNAERARLQGEHNDRLKAHHIDVQAVESRKSRLRTESARVAGDRQTLEAQVNHLLAETREPLKENCPTCGQLLPDEKRKELSEKRAISEQKLADLKQKSAAASKRIAEMDQEIAEIVSPAPPAEPELPPADQGPLGAIRAQIAGLKADQARKDLATAQEAATRSEETRKQLEAARVEVSRLEAEISEAELGIDPFLEPSYQEAKEKLEAARKEYQEAAKAAAGLEGELRGLDYEIGQLEAQEKDLAERKECITLSEGELADWRYLERSCGPDGIQALELDALGPSIAERANRILSSAFGTRFSIDFRTQRTAGKGSKSRVVEDFQIFVLDGEDGTEQELSTLSGGESVWVKNAIYAAFAITRELNTGTKFLTAFLDEMDGALDPEARANYFAMLAAIHQESGRSHTIVITHSEAAQDAIPQKILLSELAGAAHAA